MVDEGNSAPKIFRTRKAEIISGLSLVSIMGLYTFASSIVKDVNESIKTQNAICIESNAREVRALKDVMDIERAALKDAISELKQRIVYLERGK